MKQFTFLTIAVWMHLFVTAQIKDDWYTIPIGSTIKIVDTVNIPERNVDLIKIDVSPFKSPIVIPKHLLETLKNYLTRQSVGVLVINGSIRAIDKLDKTGHSLIILPCYRLAAI